jgi:hypothetical protein
VGPEPFLPPNFKPSPYVEATSMSPVVGSDNNYMIDIKRDWCIVTGMSLYLVSIGANSDKLRMAGI